jgi:hypothetical protein
VRRLVLLVTVAAITAVLLGLSANPALATHNDKCHLKNPWCGPGGDINPSPPSGTDGGSQPPPSGTDSGDYDEDLTCWSDLMTGGGPPDCLRDRILDAY